MEPRTASGGTTSGGLHRGLHAFQKYESRMSKFETDSKSEARMTKTIVGDSGYPGSAFVFLFVLNIRISNFWFVSDFGFRYSDLVSGVWLRTSVSEAALFHWETTWCFLAGLF